MGNDKSLSVSSSRREEPCSIHLTASTTTGYQMTVEVKQKAAYRDADGS
jgi:hypothetical protein